MDGEVENMTFISTIFHFDAATTEKVSLPDCTSSES